jgi:Vitamin K-dependent gamma-carboxylase
VTALPPLNPFADASRWARFWHEPVRAERLALVRVLLAFALLADQLLGYLPRLGEFFGPEGVGYAGLNDEWLLDQWYWTILFFDTDDLGIVTLVFAVWMAVTFLYMVGWQTRVMGALVWFLTMCFINRNPNIKNRGDDLLCVALFLMMFMPTGRAFSLDRWLAKRRFLRRGQPLPPDWLAPLIPPWGVRLIQIQLCVLYATTGLAKLRGNVEWDGWLPSKIAGTWWDGTSIYYVLNDVTRARVAWAELPIPWWATYGMTWATVWWETLFPLLVLWRPTRRWTLWYGVLMHVGIMLVIEVGWFSCYTLALYAAWVPDSFWERRRLHSRSEPRDEHGRTAP